MVMYLAALVLVLLIIIPVTYSRMVGRYSDEVRRLESAINMLTVKKEDAEAEVARLAGEEDDLRKRRISMVETESSLPSLGSSESSASKAAGSPEEYLVTAGLITEKDLDKAREYKSGSKSDYSIGEVLIMMDVITSADWKFAQSKCS